MELIWDAVNFFKKKMTSNRESLNAVLEAYEHKKQIDSKEWEVVYGKSLKLFDEERYLCGECL